MERVYARTKEKASDLRMMKNNKELQWWFDNLSLEDRLVLQIFVVRLYGMEVNDGKQ